MEIRILQSTLPQWFNKAYKADAYNDSWLAPKLFHIRYTVSPFPRYSPQKMEYTIRHFGRRNFSFPNGPKFYRIQ